MVIAELIVLLVAGVINHFLSLPFYKQKEGCTLITDNSLLSILFYFF
jgi:hypothetical protein